MESTEKNDGKPYHTPRLIIYGNITELTETVGSTGKTDLGGKGYAKLKTA